MSLERIEPKRLYAYELTLRIILALGSYLLPVVFYSDVQYYFLSGKGVGLHHLPYRDFVWEYPPLTTLVVPLVFITGKQTVPFHILFLAIVIMLEWGSLHLIRSFDRANFWPITKYWTITMVPIGLLAWNRLDYLAVFLSTLALVGFLQGRNTLWATLLGFFAKLWPMLIVVGMFARRQFKDVALVVGGCGLLTLAWYAFSPHGFHQFLLFRRGSGFQLESLPGSVLHLAGRQPLFRYNTASISDAGYHWLQVSLFVLTFGGVAALALVGLLRKHDEVLLIGASVALVLVSSRIISAQYVVWLIPFVALRVRTHKRIALEYFVAIVLTLVFLGGYYQMYYEDAWGPWTSVLVARNLVLLLMTIDMIQAAFRPQDDNKTSALLAEEGTA